ncbi:hypothetical protein KC349_g2123 [Hortaea werneckii]|nr:hypothetical protein KC349_g2123 [Hortaea werneckii]
MDGLPPELIELIIQQCDFASLKHMRLVAKPFEHIATPLVFRDLYAAFFAYSLDNIGKVANSRVAEHVKHLTIWADILPDWEQYKWRRECHDRPSFLAWEARRKELIAADCLQTHQTALKLYACLDADIEGGLCEECLGRIEDIRNEYRKNFPILTLEQLERAWTRFCQLKDEQWTRITVDVHGIMLKEHLSRLPNLESVAAKPVTALFENRLENLPVWKALKKDILVSPENWVQTSGPETDDLHDEHLHNTDLLGRVLQWTLEAVGQRAQFSGTKQVRRLDIVQSDPIPFNELMRAAADGSRTSDNPLAQGARFHTMVEAFSHVQDLTFELPHARQGEKYHGRHLRDETVELLRAAKNIEILKLHFPDDKLDGNQWSMRFDLSGHFSCLESNQNAFRWPHLTSLSLSTNVKADPFLSFLAAHSTTLRSLTLFEMDLGDVRKVLSAIPRVLPGLTDVHVQYVLGLIQGTPGMEDEDDVWGHYLIEGTSVEDGYHEDVKRYLLGQSEELPLLYDENLMNDSDEFEDESEEQDSETFDLDEADQS